MENKTFIVKNNNDFSVGIKFNDGSSRELNFKGNQRRPMSEFDIMNVDAESRLFKDGVLVVESQEKEVIEQMGLEADNPNAITKKEIEEILEESASTIKTKFKDITEKHAIDKIVEVAKNSEDINLTKIKTIEKLFGIEIDTEDEEVV